MYDDMSLTTYNFSKQDDYLEEDVQTVEQFWSTNFAEDFVTATFYSDNSYTLDGINGAGYAGSMGTYTSETAEDGTVTYTMTDGDDSSKVFTLTMNGASGTLEGGDLEAPYSMTSINPTIVVEFEMTGVNSWGASLTLTCYDDGTANMQIAIPGTPEFSDGLGTWTYMADGDYYVITFGTTIYTAENDGEGTYSFEYAIANANFGGEKVVVSYTLSEPLVKYTFTYTPAVAWASGTPVEMVCNAPASAEKFTFQGDLWGMPVTLECAADGTCAASIDASGQIAQDGEGTWSIADGVITIEINGATYTATVSE